LQPRFAYAREGDTVVVHSMDRLARNVDDLRRIVGVGFATEGTSRLLRDYSFEPPVVAALAKAHSKSHDPERGAETRAYLRQDTF
jgi:hypothetical protein